MDLPKNITLIGEWNTNCRVYVEDYVVSYMKQLNVHAQNKEIALALYGLCKQEEDKSYLFAYGAGKINYLQKETRHLSQAQKQEIETLRVKHFKEYTFLGYCILNGEMVEGFYICEQDICRYIAGYAQFYEKNERMLAYMLEVRSDEPKPEVVDREKYMEVHRRQEERKRKELRLQKNGKEREEKGKSLGGVNRGRWRTAALICGMGAAYLLFAGNEATIREALQKLSERKLPETMQVMGSDVAQNDALLVEEALEEQLKKENEKQQVQTAYHDMGQDVACGSEEPAQPQEPLTEEAQAVENIAAQSTQDMEVEPGEAQVQETSAKPEEMTSYIIKKGDTLLAISLRNYGNTDHVTEICTLNKILDPDNIRIGQKIFLP